MLTQLWGPDRMLSLNPLPFQNIDIKVIDDKIYLFLIYKKLVSYYY